MKSIGKTLKEILRMKNIPQVEFAKILNFSPSDISAMCSSDDMTCSKLADICKVLDVNPAVFFTDTPIGHYTVSDLSTNTVESPVSVETGDTAGAPHLMELLGEEERMIEILRHQMDVLNNAIKALTTDNN